MSPEVCPRERARDRRSPGVALLSLLVLVLGCDHVELLGTLTSGAEAGGAGGETGLVPDVPHVVEVLSDPEARDTDPSFTEDLTELYFMSDRTGNKEIWRSLRETASDPWGPPAVVSELNSPGQEENPFVANDGLSIWYFTDRARELGSQWLSTRPTREDAWGAPVAVPELAYGEGSSDVAIATDPGQTLFVLNSKPMGAPPYHLYRQERATSDDPLGPPELIEELANAANDYDPDLRQNGLFLAFESERSGTEQIYFSRRDAREDPFSEPTLVAALSTSEGEAPAFSEDQRYVMFSSNRSGNIDLYEAELSSAPR